MKTGGWQRSKSALQSSSIASQRRDLAFVLLTSPWLTLVQTEQQKTRLKQWNGFKNVRQGEVEDIESQLADHRENYNMSPKTLQLHAQHVEVKKVGGSLRRHAARPGLPFRGISASRSNALEAGQDSMAAPPVGPPVARPGVDLTSPGSY